MDRRGRLYIMNRLKEVQLRGNVDPKDIGLLQRAADEMKNMQDELDDLSDQADNLQSQLYYE